MLIALASPRVATSLEDGIERTEALLAEAAGQGAQIVCFPEAYLPGLRGMDFPVPAFDVADQDRVLSRVCELSRHYSIAAIVGMEWLTDSGRQITAVVVDSGGELLGLQTKNQLDPTEESSYQPGSSRRLFEIDGLRFGIAICHEGFRYPETVRWAATRGAHIVFHPQCTGSDRSGSLPVEWCSPQGAYYEKAIMCRALENTIYFASVNYAFRFQESATSLMTPHGECLSRLPYGREGVLIGEIEPAAATGLLASRFAPERYEEFSE